MYLLQLDRKLLRSPERQFHTTIVLPLWAFWWRSNLHGWMNCLMSQNACMQRRSSSFIKWLFCVYRCSHASTIDYIAQDKCNHKTLISVPSGNHKTLNTTKMCRILLNQIHGILKLLLKRKILLMPSLLHQRRIQNVPSSMSDPLLQYFWILFCIPWCYL